MTKEQESNREAAQSPSAAPACSISAKEVVRQFESNVETGLSDPEVRDRRVRYGLNQLAESNPPSIWWRLLSQFKQLVVWILIVAAMIAGLMGEWIDTLAILVIVVGNGIIGFVQEEKAGRALAALRAMSSPMARVLRNRGLTTIPAKDLVPGDIIQLEAGDNVPADARLVEAFGFTAQEASLTGESVPVEKEAGLLLPGNAALGDRGNSVFMGTIVAHGKATAIVTATAMNTELGSIARMLGQAESEPTPLQRRLAELGRILVVVCLLMVGIIFTIQMQRGGELLETMLVAVSLGSPLFPKACLP